ncbi:MAG: DNA replication complex GINS family protein [archaeon GB-1867-035]|nr:DNA replication complex GINS family protein [Candidatus Culexmicrobium profundum]
MFKQIIKASHINYDTSPIRAVVKEARPSIEVAGNRIDLSSIGFEIQIPRWIALKLMELGVVDLKVTEELSLRELLRVMWKESREINLTVIDPHFYPKLRAYLKRLRERCKKEPLPELIQELHKVETTARDIISCRLQKIIQAALSEALPPNVLEAMTIEEKNLLIEVSQIVEKWKRQILALGEN